MFKQIKLGIHQTLELLKDSYKYIDFRCVLYRKDGIWNRILTVLRFSNENADDIKRRFIDLELKKFNIKNLKIIYEVIDVSGWEEIIIEIYDEINEDIEIYDTDEFYYDNNKYEEYRESFLDDFRSIYNTKTARLLLTENEVKHHNIINYYYSTPDRNEHHNRFNIYLNEEVRLLGEDNIYNIINRVMQLDGYGSQNGLYVSIILPIYVRIKELNSEKGILSGKVDFHKIFFGSKIFFRIFSKPNYENESLCGTEEFLIDFETKEATIIHNDYYEIPFDIDFSKYDCDPNFEIKIYWEKFNENYIVDFQKSFGSPRYFQEFEDQRAELIEDDHDSETLEFRVLINPSISIDDDYKKIITSINNTYNKGYYDCAYVLVRKLLENQLIDCLRAYYSIKNVETFYRNGKFLPFSELRLNFNRMINEEKFKALVGPIPQNTVDYLEIFKEMGDSSAHSFFSTDHKPIMEDNAEKLKILLEFLFKINRVLLKNIQGIS